MNINFESTIGYEISKRGYEYYKNNLVSDVSKEEFGYSAKVMGSKVYNVSVKLAENIFLGGSCTCPYNETGDYCKHIAALLYYLNEHEIDPLKNIIDEIDIKDLKGFLYNILNKNENLMDDFRINFSNHFPKLDKNIYVRKIYNDIENCCDYHGFISYGNVDDYEQAMLKYIYEASNLISTKDYETALIIISTILNSIPETAIDDSDGSTGLISEQCLELLGEILEENDNNLIKDEILEYILDDLSTLHLYNNSIDLFPLLEYYLDDDAYKETIKKSLEDALEKTKDKEYFFGRKKYVKLLIDLYIEDNEIDKVDSLLEKYSMDSEVCMMLIDKLLDENKIDKAINILKNKITDDIYESRTYAERLEQIYYDNNMVKEYKELLYEELYKYKKYDMEIYKKIKNLYTSVDWIK